MFRGPFIAGEAIGRAQAQLSRPPLRSWIERPTPKGRRVATFALHLDLCKPQNRKHSMQRWQLEKMKKDVYLAMLVQLSGGAPSSPLPGRPQVFCVRFSSTPPDNYADGFKMAVDCLTPRKGPDAKGRIKLGFGLIADDNPRVSDVKQWWEPAPRGGGFGYLAVWTGGTP